MRRIEDSVRQRLKPGAKLYSVPGRAQFEVKELSDDALVLLFGQKKTRTVIRWSYLEGVSSFLEGKAWVEIGAVHKVSGVAGTLDGYIKGCGLRRTTGGYVAAVLLDAGIVDVDPSRPARIRLKSYP